jgi:putative transposase
MAQFNITITEELLHGLFLSNGRDEAFSKLLEEIFNQVLLAQSSEQIRAEPYERTEERTAYRNGYRNRELTTRVGTLTLRVPVIAMANSLQSYLPGISVVNKHWFWQ